MPELLTMPDGAGRRGMADKAGPVMRAACATGEIFLAKMPSEGFRRHFLRGFRRRAGLEAEHFRRRVSVA
ncbi:hypothetical protein [Neisseria benedictiae]|uniref:hypothetical protein n=1 Tax=Neisseria benedictiae TaxID=2830649 RepID=UPI002658270C|nr:hypothetical protein [Neisseria benedictiae]